MSLEWGERHVFFEITSVYLDGEYVFITGIVFCFVQSRNEVNRGVCCPGEASAWIYISTKPSIMIFCACASI